MQAIVDERGIVGLMVSPELKPARIVEPGTPEAVRMAEDLAPARAAPETEKAAPGQAEARATPSQAAAEDLPKPTAEQIVPDTKPPSLFDAVPLGERPDGGDARMMSRETALAEFERQDFFGDLVEACKV